MTWYLLFSATLGMGGYLGPMTLEECTKARDTMFTSAICRQPTVYSMCPVAGHPSVSTACPDFTALPVERVQ